MSAWLLTLVGLLVVTGWAGLAVGGLLAARRVWRIERFLGKNEVPGMLYAPLGMVYGTLLAFMVFAVWNRYSTADGAVTTEAANLVVVFRDTQEFPSPYREQAQEALRTYANTVIATEWASHGSAREHNAPDLLNPVWAIYRQIVPGSSMESAHLADATANLHELER